MSRRRVALVLAALGVAGAVAVAAAALLTRGDDWELADRAPGAPGRGRTWASAAKEGLGTAYNDPARGEARSRVWFTLARGVVTEVLYPDVSTAQLRSLQLAVTDGETFTDLEEEATTNEVAAEEDAPVFLQVNTARNGRYRIERTTVADPTRDAVLVETTFRALRGDVSDYDVWLVLDPNLANGSLGDDGAVVERNGRTYLVADEGETAVALAASTPLERATTGFVDVSDGVGALRSRHRLERGFREARDGNVRHLARLELPSGRDATFVVALGFGPDAETAVATAQTALTRPFAETADAYRRPWRAYVRSLRRPPPGAGPLYHIAAMTLRAHEDKRHAGAFVASLSLPWSHLLGADDASRLGYRLVWARDLYQTATALALAGDEESARRALAYLDETQQLESGGFPQNSLPNGQPEWRGTQLDEAAMPILLAGQLEEGGRYGSLVKPAADFLLANGPRTPQERWEEEGGYSPSTLASEIAALVVAARLAREAGDAASASRYVAAADRWAARVDDWTVRRSGPLSREPYYLRLSTTGDPNDDSTIDIANGAGVFRQAEIVDAGFLELVRLGIVAADDATIARSLDVVDRHIRWDAPYGPTWYRYSHDAYGEDRDGATPTQGHPWPLLTGERGEYEVALARSRGRARPKNVWGADRLLATMREAANGGGMIAEQVWDREPVPRLRLEPGAATGSATPLAWSMAQYIRLAECIRAGRVVEMPPEVARHFGTGP